MATDNTEDIGGENKMQRSAYAAVIFHNVAEMYPADAHIECSYTITSDIVPSTRDWVGLYKVGWMSPNGYFYYEWAPLPKNYQPESEAQSEILFQAHNLPDDDGEFYQFCYVSNSGQIRGASTPFQFKRPSANDFIEVEDTENDIMIVRDKTSYLEETLKEAVGQKASLVQQQEVMVKERSELKAKLSEVRRQLRGETRAADKLKKEYLKLKQEFEDNNSNTNDLILVHDELSAKIEMLSKEKQKAEERIEELDALIVELKEREKVLQNEKDELDGANRMLKEETEMFKNHLTKFEGTVSNYARDMKNMQKDVDEKEKYIAACQMEIATLKSSLHHQSIQSEKHNLVMASNIENVDKLQEKLRNTEDKLEAAVRVKEIMSIELAAYSSTNDDLNKELQARQTENLELKKNVERMELGFSQESEVLIRENDGVHRDLCNVVKDKEELQKQVTKLQEEVNKDSTTGPMYALTIANDTLKQRHILMKAEVAKTQADMKAVQVTAITLEKELRREIEDLKERIIMCSDSYRHLYKENVKIQKRCKHCKTRILSESADTFTFKRNKIERTETVALVTSHSNTDHDNMSSKETESEITNKDIKDKVNKYKKLFVEERLKLEAVKHQYSEEMTKKDIEINTLRSTITARPNELEHKLMSCTSFLAEKDKMIEELNHKLRDLKVEHEGSKSPSIFQQPGPFLQTYGYPYPLQNIDPARASPLPPLIYPHIPRNTPTHTPGLSVSSSQDHLSDSDNSDGLPQPISPTILPSAKVAAIKASYYPYLDDQTDFVDAPSEFEKTMPTAPFDLEEDKFVDAKGVGMKTCPNCNKSFSPDITDSEFEQHVLNHSGRICPVCNLLADDNTTDADFQYHVNCCIDNKDKNE